MATYWVPDLPTIKGIPGRIRCSTLIFTNSASYAWSSKHKKDVSSSLWLRDLKITHILKSSGNITFYSGRCVSCKTICLPIFNGLRCKLTKIFIYFTKNGFSVWWLTSSVISFAYFTQSSNLNISWTNVDICQR